MLDLVEEPLDQIAVLVNLLVVDDGLRPGAVRRHYGLGPGGSDRVAEAIGVVTLVGEQLLERQPADEILGLSDVVHMTRGEDEAERVAKRIDPRIDLCAQAAARAPDRLIFAAPFAPAACWCARTMELSTIRYSKSGFSINALKRLSHTPFL